MANPPLVSCVLRQPLAVCSCVPLSSYLFYLPPQPSSPHFLSSICPISLSGLPFSPRSFVKVERMVQSPVEWSVADVVSYFTEAGFPEQATAFRMQVCVQLPPAATRAQHCSTPLFSLVSVPSVCL